MTLSHRVGYIGYISYISGPDIDQIGAVVALKGQDTVTQARRLNAIVAESARKSTSVQSFTAQIAPGRLVHSNERRNEVHGRDVISSTSVEHFFNVAKQMNAETAISHIGISY